MRCDECVFWDDEEYGDPGQHICEGLDTEGFGFSNYGCSFDYIYCTSPDFYCARFKANDEAKMAKIKTKKSNEALPELHCRFCSKSEDRNLCEVYMRCLAAAERSADPVADLSSLLEIGKIAQHCKAFERRE